MRPIRPFLLACAAGALLLPACADDTTTSVAGGDSVAATTDDASQAATTDDASQAATETAVTVETAAFVEALDDHDDAEDHEWDAASEIAIELTGESVTITEPGTYRLSGTLTDGQVIVDSQVDGMVRLILDGVDITSSTGAAIAILAADEAMIVLADGSTNTLTDAATYVFPDAETDEPNAALYSAADLTITGEAAGDGTLVVDGNYNDGIGGKDGVVITSGVITVTAVDDGIRGKDYLLVEGGTITVDAGGQGLKSDFDEDDTKGAVVVTDGSVAITAEGDAIHSDNDVVLAGGSITISTGDDAVHADDSLLVSGGTLDITESYEGLEALAITIAGGNSSVVASDDGVNGSGGDATLTITGGTLLVDAAGDGLDVNGSITMTGGTVLVNGPTEQMNGAIDYDGTFDISGGLLVAVGSSGMLQAPTQGSSQLSLMATFDTQQGGTAVHIAAADGTPLLTFVPTKAFQAVVVSSADIAEGVEYEVSLGGSTSGDDLFGLYDAGAYEGGEVVATMTSADAVSTGMGGGGMGGGGMGGPGGGGGGGGGRP